jgi:hypothetical protein
MLTQVARAGRLAVAAVLALCIIPVSSCDKVPLTAPSGTVITLLPPSTDAAPLRVPLNSELEIIATAIEQGTTATTPPANGTTPTTPAATPGAGTPVHNGTLITFTTTIGRIEPAEARTNNGQVRVRFLSGNASGIGTITAFSGGASGQLVGIRVGGAAAERVVISASPQTIHHRAGRRRSQHASRTSTVPASRVFRSASQPTPASCRPQSPTPIRTAWRARR